MRATSQPPGGSRRRDRSPMEGAGWSASRGNSERMGCKARAALAKDRIGMIGAVVRP